MRKPILLILLFGVLLALAACGATPTPAPTTAPPTAAPTVAPATPTPVPPTATRPPAPAGTPAPATPTPVVARGRLATVLGRGRLICGINGQLAGFSSLQPDGSFTGIDADFCRAVAAALFNDPKLVDFRPLTTAQRFAALQGGEVDVLFRNTTFTLNRDTAVGLDFLPTTFYDGGGMLVPKKNNIKKLEDLTGATVCVLTGTTNELVLADVFRARNIKYTPLTFPEPGALYKAYDEGRCDAATSDKSQLAGQRASLLSKPDEHEVMADTLSKEPLGPAVAQGDPQWADVIKWVVYATIQAEEFGITTKNADEMLKSENPDIKRFLGVTGTLGKDMALAPDAFFRAIKHVGNYGEIYDKNLGPATKLNIPRGLNQLYSKGGLLYSPPFR